MEWHDRIVEEGYQNVVSKWGTPLFEHKSNEWQVVLAIWARYGSHFAMVFAHGGLKPGLDEFMAGNAPYPMLGVALGNCPGFGQVEQVYLCVCDSGKSGFARKLSGCPQLKDRLVWAPKAPCGIQKLALQVCNPELGNLQALEQGANGEYTFRDARRVASDWVVAMNGDIL